MANNNQNLFNYLNFRHESNQLGVENSVNNLYNLDNRRYVKISVRNLKFIIFKIKNDS